MIVSAPRLFIDGAFAGPASIVVADDVITEIGPLRDDADIALDSGFLAPGLIDLHNNGAFGVDCATASPAEWGRLIDGLAACGVTSVLPTIITAPNEAIFAAAVRVAAAAKIHPAILGLHLEGPFLAARKRGAHRADWLQAPDAEAVAALLADAALKNILAMVTLAPELPGALAAIRRLVAAGIVVSLGHTAADAAQMRAGADAGARLVTHLFNAQSALNHRAPGAPGVALTDPRLHPCLIADGIHVDPAVLQLAFAACGRSIAVSDSIALAGLAAGAAQNFGGATVTLGADGVGRRTDGTIAGAGITLDEGLRRLIRAGVPPETAFAAATSRPAEALGITDRGRIAVGARADLVLWDDDFTVRRVWTAGQDRAVLPRERRGTEYARPDLLDLDERNTPEIVAAFLAQERAAQSALTAAAASLAALADATAAKLAAGGRLFYAGAGTSGRLALLDAVECGPTFGVPDGLLVPLLAGGVGAFPQAVEGAEDDGQAAVVALRAEKFSANDVLVGIAASGTTPFTLAALEYAGQMGALTGAIVNNPASPIAAAVVIAVVIDSGPEIIAGSTRLAAGTTQKIALNILSSTVMVRLGKTFGPYMVDLRATNAKLRGRAARMVAAIAGVGEPAAQAALAAAEGEGEGEGEVKTAILILRLKISPQAARKKLQQTGGNLRQALA